MDIITIEGDALEALIRELSRRGASCEPYRLRVAYDEDTVKFKLDEGMWSPPYPAADEDVRRRAAQPRERGWQVGHGNTQTNYFGGS
jgi:hypothetical protein